MALSIPLGGVFAGTIFGLYLLITCGWFGLNNNDAFSAMKLDSHRHFLRIRIQGDTLQIFPVAVDRVPKRDEWAENPQRSKKPLASVFVPPETMVPHLVEGPIIVSAHHAPLTSDIKPATDLATSR